MGRLPIGVSDVEARILDAMIDLDEGASYDEISVIDVCERAELSRQTFYRHFKRKEDVYLAHLDRLLDEVSSGSQRGMAYDELFDSMGTLFAGNRRFLNCLFRAGLDSRILYRYERLLTSIGPSKGLGRNDLLVQTFIAGGVFNVMKRWALSGDGAGAKEVADALKVIATPIVETTRARNAGKRVR